MTKEAEVQPIAVPKIQCRYCKGDHWTTKCPHKDLYIKLEEQQAKEAENTKTTSQSGDSSGANVSSTGKYIPPNLRPGAQSSQAPGKKYEPKSRDEYTIRVTNLPEEATDTDLSELFKPFGKVQRVFLARDRTTHQSRGFAFVTFQSKEDAQRAIYGVNDYGYHHLILKVEWAK